MKIEVLRDADAVARRGAEVIAAEAREAVSQRGVFVLAVSGGATPWKMYGLLAEEAGMPWGLTHLFQVDERYAPPDSPERNMTHLREVLLGRLRYPLAGLHPMPVDDPDPDKAADRYAAVLREICGDSPVLDLVHLGLGADGHTASLAPGDPVLNVTDVDVALTDAYDGRRRMTLTRPLLNRARRVLWVVTGAEKAGMLARLRDGDTAIPAGSIRRDGALVLADGAAAERL